MSTYDSAGKTCILMQHPRGVCRALLCNTLGNAILEHANEHPKKASLTPFFNCDIKAAQNKKGKQDKDIYREMQR